MTNVDKILTVAQSKQGKGKAIGYSEDRILLDDIQDRYHGNTRLLDGSHVEGLAESIAVLGLLEPIVVDKLGRLLAGGHRRAALHLLRDEKPEVYQEKFPDNLVKVNRLTFDSKEHPNLALAVEAAENEKRRDYSPSEVRAIAERLRAAGYEDVKGRPRKGQKPLMPALTVVVGKHLRTVQRYFSSESEESTTDAVLSEAPHRTLKQALTKLKAWQKHEPQTVKEKKLAQELPKLLRLIEAVLQQDNVD